MKILIKTNITYKHTSENICINCKATTFANTKKYFLIDNVALNLENISGIYLLYRGIYNTIYEDNKILTIGNIEKYTAKYEKISKKYFDIYQIPQIINSLKK